MRCEVWWLAKAVNVSAGQISIFLKKVKKSLQVGKQRNDITTAFSVYNDSQDFMMAASFYTRYIPPQEPTSVSPAEATQETTRQPKRKREIDDAPIKNNPAKKQKEKRVNAPADVPSTPSSVDNQTWQAAGHAVDSNRETGLSRTKARKEKGHTSPLRSEQEPDRDTRKHKRIYNGDSAQMAGNTSKPGGEVESAGNIAHEAGTGDGTSSDISAKSGESKILKEPKKARKSHNADIQQAASIPGKHAGVFSKFKQSRLRSDMQAEESDEDPAHPDISIEDTPVSHGLEPLPQPAVTSDPLERPSYSSLPSWLSKPLTVSSKLRTKFNDLDISPKLRSNLSDQGYTEAFAIQSALIPLLLKGPRRHLGDVCISAATGSGKTLAYALPLIANLESLTVAKLRGLIIVPTRELVRQAREACDLCVGGTGLRIGTAVGSVSLKEEEQALMRKEQVYDSYRSQKNCIATESWEQFRLQEYISEMNERSELLPGHVKRTSSNVDILICTPGRLVDHIRSTKGFTLEHLDWLVIDEADRLLNESFQDWVQVVVRALDQGKAPDLSERADRLLVDMGMPVKRQEPQKVILSATMTQDITKLNSLRLRNPKLVTVREHEAENQHMDIPQNLDQSFAVPPTLNEFMVSVGDGADKPLYLLQLLLSHIGIENKGVSAPKQTGRSTSKLPPSSVSDETDSSSDESSDSSDASSSSASSTLETATPSQNTVLIFTKSSESASRLSRLLSLIHPGLANRVGTLTRPSKSSTSRKTLTAFRRGKVSVIVATDRASRGLDLPALGHVVNYDVPSSLTTYVHRIGRTARAGNEGSAWTLVAHREGRWFSNEIAREGHNSITRPGKVRKVNLKLDESPGLQTVYENALREVGKEVNSGTSRKESETVD